MAEPAASDLAFFDCNATVGRAASPILGNWLSADDLLDEMSRFGIGSALVSHVFAQELNDQVGNDLILEQTSMHDRLVPQATVFPTYTAGSPPTDSDVTDLITKGFRAFRIHPNPTHHIMDEAVYARQFPFVPDVVGEICSALERQHRPLFVEMAQVTWTEVYEVCRTFPGLPVVLLNVSYTHKRSLFAGLNKFANLHCDTSCYHAYRGLEEVCDLFGPERMLFGSRLPSYNALAGAAMVRYARLPAQARACVAGGNLRRLLIEGGRTHEP